MFSSICCYVAVQKLKPVGDCCHSPSWLLTSPSPHQRHATANPTKNSNIGNIRPFVKDFSTLPVTMTATGPTTRQHHGVKCTHKVWSACPFGGPKGDFTLLPKARDELTMLFQPLRVLGCDNLHKQLNAFIANDGRPFLAFQIHRDSRDYG
jgi:hypothetical protein